MSDKNYVTHFKGKPLAQMNREECIEALQHYSALLAAEREKVNSFLQKTGRSLVESWG